MKRLIVVLVSILGVLLPLTGNAMAAPSSTNSGAASICNVSYLPLGVIHAPDGSYTYTNYDERLPGQPNATTAYCSSTVYGWPHTGGIYVSPGYAAQIYDHTQVHFLLNVEGGFSGNWWFPNNPNEVYFVQRCQYDSRGAAYGCNPV